MMPSSVSNWKRFFSVKLHIAPLTEAPPPWTFLSFPSWVLNWRQLWQRRTVSVIERIKRSDVISFLLNAFTLTQGHKHLVTDCDSPATLALGSSIFKKNKQKTWWWWTSEWPCFCSQNLAGGGSTAALELSKDCDFIFSRGNSEKHGMIVKPHCASGLISESQQQRGELV